IFGQIHERGHGLGLAQRSCKVRVRVTPLVDGRPAITDVVEVGMTGIEAVKLGDHCEFSVPYQPWPDYRISNWYGSVRREWDGLTTCWPLAESAPFARWARRRRAFEDQGHRSREPAYLGQALSTK